MIFGRESRPGLAPRSWTAVGVWLVLAAVVITRPVESIGFIVGAVKGTGEWVGYTAFGECESAPPMDWMEPKPCPPEPGPTDGADGHNPGDTHDAAPTREEGYVVRVDDQAVHDVLDQGVDVITDLHATVVDIQHQGGVTVEIGEPGNGRSGDG